MSIEISWELEHVLGVHLADLPNKETFNLVLPTDFNSITDVLMVIENPCYTASTRYREALEQGRKMLVFNITKGRIACLRSDRKVRVLNVRAEVSLPCQK